VPANVNGKQQSARHPGASPNQKDDVESELQHHVCDGDMSLGAAQAAIATDWTTALRAAQ
jgi:hypothetical protein